MNLTLDQWLELDVRSRARHLVSSVSSLCQPVWVTKDILISELYDLHPDSDHEHRVYVDLAGIDFLGPNFLRSFYNSHGHGHDNQGRAARELHELSTSEQHENFGAPDLGHDLDYDAKVEDYIRSSVARDLMAFESSVHDELLARGQLHAYVDRHELDVSTDQGRSCLVLIVVTLSSGNVFSIMPWDGIADWKELADGDWVEVGGLEDDSFSMRPWITIWDEDAGENNSTSDAPLVDAQGMDLSLPEPDEASPAEEESWRNQLLAEYADDDTGDTLADEPAKGRADASDEVDPGSGLEWKL